MIPQSMMKYVFEGGTEKREVKRPLTCCFTPQMFATAKAAPG